MKDYYIEREVDGHPICFNGCSQTKKEIVNDLNDMLSTITSLYKAEKQLQKDKAHILDVMETMIPLTVCDKELKSQWKKLIKKSKHNSIGEDDE